jgi:hypothetical protein
MLVLDCWSSISGGEKGFFFLYFTASTPYLGSTQPPTHWVRKGKGAGAWKIEKLYLHSPMRLHVVVLKSLDKFIFLFRFLKETENLAFVYSKNTYTTAKWHCVLSLQTFRKYLLTLFSGYPKSYLLNICKYLSDYTASHIRWLQYFYNMFILNILQL